ALGQYTFKDVMANHSIEVKTTSGYGGGDPEEPPGGGGGGTGGGGTGDGGGGFTDDAGMGGIKLGYLIVGLLLLILAGLLIWLLIYRRKKYDVVKVGSSEEIIENDTVKRKQAYSFSLDGSYARVSYKVGEDGAWKTIIPDVQGVFTIPKGEIIDNVRIELL
ncbi:MAG: hypothetical protein FWC44_03705, partial [Methanomassiliicoccaceae archaeon]|nr:hypothetical protein [Methanomassiliicoccaceae archaeon]